MESKESHLSTADMAAASEKRELRREAEPVSGEAKNQDDVSRTDTKTADSAKPHDADLVPLFSNEAVQDFRSRWTALQTGFVDEPRRAVQEADELVAEVIKQLAETFSDERAKLERQWDQGDKVSTEDLRLVLRRYRSFFDRFLSI
jgi:membrane-anchored protein YejM (alkaline phosphatase superfamily)